MEVAGTVSAQTGWLPQHVVVEDDDGGLWRRCLIQAIPRASMVRHAWAHAFERAGGNTSQIDFGGAVHAVPGPRLLICPDQTGTYAGTFVAGLIEAVRVHDVSSLHLNFLPEEDAAALGELGFCDASGW